MDCRFLFVELVKSGMHSPSFPSMLSNLDPRRLSISDEAMVVFFRPNVLRPENNPPADESKDALDCMPNPSPSADKCVDE